MSKELTYEEALANVAVSCSQAYSEFYMIGDKSVRYGEYEVFEEDYESLKKLEEAIEKAKRYDELAKEKEK